MGIYRNTTEILRREVASDADAMTDVFIVRPADGDSLVDGAQGFVLTAFAEATGPGSILVSMWNSFGDDIWFEVTNESIELDGKPIYGFNALRDFAPYVFVIIRSAPPPDSEVKPAFTARVRLASDGPYRIEHRPVPTSKIEVTQTFEWGQRSKGGGL